MPINDILILINNSSSNAEETTIEIAKIIIKNKKYRIFAQFLEFYDI